MHIYKTTFGLLAVVLAAAMVQAAAPTISCKTDGNDLIVTYTGTLYQSEDAVHWTEVASASSPYQVKMGNKKLFFCSKGGSNQPFVPGESFSTSLPGGVSLDMIWCPPGSFMMGSPEDELGRNNIEIQHQVTLTSGYWLGKYEVTQAQYEAVVGKNPSYFQLGDDLPVEMVSWDDAMDFCAKLTAIEKEAGRLPEGYGYTLPTEAQWEYACRAGTTTALNSGKNLSDYWECPEMDEVGWYWYDGGKENYENNLICTHPGGQKKPNAWGIYDMHGNVDEWCLDWAGDYPDSAVTDPTGPAIGYYYHVIRGGNWGADASYCRSALRSNSSGTDYDYFCGFRVALAPVK